MKIRSVKDGQWLDSATWENAVVPDADDIAVIRHDVLVMKTSGDYTIRVGAIDVLPGGRLLGTQWSFLELQHNGDYDGDGNTDDTSYLGGEIYDNMTYGFVLIIPRGKLLPRPTVRRAMIQDVSIILEAGDHAEKYT